MPCSIHRLRPALRSSLCAVLLAAASCGGDIVLTGPPETSAPTFPAGGGQQLRGGDGEPAPDAVPADAPCSQTLDLLHVADLPQHGRAFGRVLHVGFARAAAAPGARVRIAVDFHEPPTASAVAQQYIVAFVPVDPADPSEARFEISETSGHVLLSGGPAENLASLKTDRTGGAFELELPARAELQLRLARVLFTDAQASNAIRSTYTLRSEPADALRFDGCSAVQRELPVIR